MSHQSSKMKAHRVSFDPEPEIKSEKILDADTKKQLEEILKEPEGEPSF